MKTAAILGGLALLFGMVGTASAEPGVGITAPAPDRLERRAPRYERTYPNDVAAEAAGRGVYYAPVFIGPTAKGETAELGFSAWIAPFSPVGLQPGGGDVGGWTAIGVTAKWGDPPRRPSPGNAIR